MAEYQPNPLLLLAIAPQLGPSGPELPASQLALVAPELAVLGPDGDVWGINYERAAVALWAVARSLLAQLEVERRRSDQLDRRTRWLYENATGQQLPDKGDK